jgi:hypothetical protein
VHDPAFDRAGADRDLVNVNERVGCTFHSPR